MVPFDEFRYAIDFVLGAMLGVAFTAILAVFTISAMYELGWKDGQLDILTRVGKSMRDNYSVRDSHGRRL